MVIFNRIDPLRFTEDNIYSGTLSPHWGPKDPSGVQSSLYVRLYLCVSSSLSGHPRCFLEIIHAAHNCAQSMWSQAMGSNTLSGSIICPSVRPSVRPSGYPRAFFNFCICIYFLCGDPTLQCIYPHTGVRRTPVWAS